MKLFIIILVSLMLSVSTTLAANEDFFLGVKYNNIAKKNEIYKINQKTGVSTLLKQFSFPSGYWQPGASFMDSYNGNLYLKDSNGQYLQYNYLTDTLTTTPAMDSDYQTMFQTPWAGSTIVSEAADGSVHIGKNFLVTIEQNGAVDIKTASRHLLILLIWHLDRCRQRSNHSPRPHQNVFTNPSI